MSGVRRTVWHSHRLFHVLITFLVAVMDAENRFVRMIVFRGWPTFAVLAKVGTDAACVGMFVLALILPIRSVVPTFTKKVKVGQPRLPRSEEGIPHCPLRDKCAPQQARPRVAAFDYASARAAGHGCFQSEDGNRRGTTDLCATLADRRVSARLDQRALRPKAVPLQRSRESSHGSHLGLPKLQLTRWFGLKRTRQILPA